MVKDAVATRIRYLPDEKRNVDIALEDSFHALYHDECNDLDDICVKLIDSIGQAMLGDAYTLSLATAFVSMQRAVDWSSQFGQVYLWKLSEYDERTDIPTEHEFAATVDEPAPDNALTSSKTAQRAVILAGVQYMRKISYATLNHGGGSSLH